MAARQLPTGTVTLLFTDIEGSTRLLQELGRDAYVRALTDHRRLLREAFTKHGGVEVEMQGDSFHFAFERGADAVRAAAVAQKALDEHVWESKPIRVRIGIHTGAPVVSDGLYAGLDVHRAARVMSAGHGGQVLVSETTRALVEDEFGLRDLGMHRLDDLARPLRLYQLGDGSFPPLKTLGARSLPVPATPLVGREREVGELVSLLSNGPRVLTVTGPGGVGKTRLAIDAALELGTSFADGVYWVPLAAVSDPELVLPTIAQAVGERDDPAVHLGRQQILLVLDNFEHLLTAAPRLAELLAAAPNTKALVTSRAPLQIDGEHAYQLDSLASDDAVRLFVDRARAAGRRVAADAAADEICRRLDRLPLAIELAAARTSLMAPNALLRRLERRLPVLAEGRRDAPERQRTLEATIEWSYDLLDERGKQTFARLSVFAGSFSMDSAEDVCDADVNSLASLVELSLLKPVGDDRFLMLETIREYGRLRLDTAGELLRISRRHAEHFLELAEEAAPHLKVGGDQATWLARLEPEHDNIGAALTFLSGHEPDLQLRLIAAAWWFLWSRGSILEARRWLTESLAHARGDAKVRARALEGAAYLAYKVGALDESRRLCDERLAIYRRLGDEVGVGSVLFNLGNIAAVEGDDVRAHSLFRESLRLLGDDHDAQYALAGLGILAHVHGEQEEARAYLDRALEIDRRYGDERGVASSSIVIAMTHIAEGATDAAAVALREVLDIGERLREVELLARYVFVVTARWAADQQAADAARLLGQSDHVLARLAIPLMGPLRRTREETLSLLADRLPLEEADRLRAEGAELALEEAAELTRRLLDAGSGRGFDGDRQLRRAFRPRR